MIEGVIITPLKQIRDDRGAVFHMLRTDAPHFPGFGEIYFSAVNPGVKKGWKKHNKMVMSLTVPHGQIKLVLMDDRPDSTTNGLVQEIILGESSANYKLITVPAGIWAAFTCLGDTPAILANCASILHHHDEAENRPLEKPPQPYEW